MSSNNKIREKLDGFIRKYYKNLLIRGGIYAVAILLVLFLVAVGLEYFGYFSVAVRTVFFWFYLACVLFLGVFYVLIPLLKMNRFGKHLSYQDASKIIGDFFPEVRDKLTNLLQLEDLEDSPSNELLEASIEQKTAELSPIPFVDAINLKGNLKYLKYAAVPLGIILLALLINPSFIMEPSKRIIDHSTVYEKPAPFSFEVENNDLKVVQQEDFLLKVEIVGDEIPNEVEINISGLVYKMQPVDKTHYSYLFKNVQGDMKFFLQAVGVNSNEYVLEVLSKPTIVDFQVLLDYPAYTHKASEQLSNVGDLTVPEGTKVSWVFSTKDVEELVFFYDGHQGSLTPSKGGRITKQLRVMRSAEYGFYGSNRNVSVNDSLQFSLVCVQDASPMIAVVEMKDSLDDNRVFFKGRIKDDYGFSKLEFKVRKSNKNNPKELITTYPVAITAESSQEFYYSFNMSEVSLMPGDRVEYYFEVWDNDGIRGPKSATSQTFEISIPSQDELENILEKNSQEAQGNVEKSISELRKLQQDIDELMRKLVDKKDLNWQDKKQLEDLAKKQKEIREQLKSMKERISENNRLEEKYREQNEQIMEKQKELNRLLDEVMNDEMKEMMKEIDRLLNETDKKKVQEQLENLKMDNKDLQKQLDQDLELMKRLEMEKKVESTIKKIDELAEKQKKLSQESLQSKDKESLMNQQKQFNEEFNKIKKDIDDIRKDYKQIDQSLDFKVNKELENQIDSKQNDAQSQLQKGKNKDASNSQKSAAEDMEKLSEQMAEAQMDMEQEELAEDAEMVRSLLKNLVHLSFDQEALIQDVNSTYIQDPKYQQIIAKQNLIRDNFGNVEDSLRSMAKRQIMVASAINKELSNINQNVSKSLSGLLQLNQSFYGNSKNSVASKNMQSTMTSFNNLALILAESLDKMQDQMRQNQQQKKQGNCKRKGQKKSSSCSNPGSGKPSPKSMKQMQEELNKQMQALKKELEKQGNKQGQRTKIGEGNSVSEEFAKMAAQQEQIRRMMQEYGKEIKNQGGNSKLAREIDEMIRQMEQTETDLVNKTITQQTLRRQQQIMTRLLEHEKADMKREKEEKRQSTEGKEMFQNSNQSFEQFEKLKEKNLDLFQSTPPSLKPYYKEKVNNYFYNL